MTAVIVIVVIIVIAALAASAVAARRQRLRRQFGPEYDRTVEEQSSTFRAEAELAERQRRVRKLHIRPLSDEARRGYAADWLAIQENFVNSPQAAVSEAYELVTRVMADRGYPAADDDQAFADLSVDHAQTVGHFRSAREITRSVTESAIPADGVTEELRQALIHYRALFSDLLGVPATNGNAALLGGAVAGTGAVPGTGAGTDTAAAEQASEPTTVSAEETPEDPVTDDEPQSMWR
jgi:hypothetical protein